MKPKELYLMLNQNGYSVVNDMLKKDDETVGIIKLDEYGHIENILGLNQKNKSEIAGIVDYLKRD